MRTSSSNTVPSAPRNRGHYTWRILCLASVIATLFGISPGVAIAKAAKPEAVRIWRAVEARYLQPHISIDRNIKKSGLLPSTAPNGALTRPSLASVLLPRPQYTPCQKAAKNGPPNEGIARLVACDGT